MKTLIFLVPVIGGVTGWLILSITLKLLFRPKQPFRLWGNMIFQGLVPGKQAQLALGVREMIEAQLLHAVTKDTGTAPEVFNKITDTVAISVRQRTEQKLPGILPTVVRGRIAAAVEDIIRREAPGFIEAIIDNLRTGKLKEQDFCLMLEEKIRLFDTGTMEEALSTSKEAFHLKAGGAVIGFMAGLLQLVIVRMAVT